MGGNKLLMKGLADVVKAVGGGDYNMYVQESVQGNYSVGNFTQFQKTFESVDSAIHAICMTKFDVVGEKVGTVVNVCFESGVGVDFVGVGQKYDDLRGLGKEELVDGLVG